APRPAPSTLFPYTTLFRSRVLLADIGGTNARFALADTGAEQPLLTDGIQEFAVADFPSLADAARHYLDSSGLHDDGIREGVFAVDRKSTRLNSSHVKISYA